VNDRPTRATVHVVLPDGVEVTAGTVTSEGAPGSASPSMVFRYADEYLAERRGYDLSPDLPRSLGPLRTWAGRPALGALGDAMPDDWGRRIIRAGTKAVTSFDYLVHVNDATRQGALRLSDDQGYLGAHPHPVAKVHELERIITAARAFEHGVESDDELRILLDAGTSAGGARPKAIVSREGTLWIAKFARETEFNNPMAWEAAALDLARAAGIDTPPFELVRIRDSNSILLTRRFDRDGVRRIGYISAHSLVTKVDSDPSSYSHLSDTLALSSSAPARDQAALFRRIALNLLIGNVDDHLRNHGFLRVAEGWSISPVFDLEPNRQPDRVEATPITDGGARMGRDIRELRDTHDAFRLSRHAAESIIRDVAERTTDWRGVAIARGISPEAAHAMRHAFENRNRDHALSMGEKEPGGSPASENSGTPRRRRGDAGLGGNRGRFA
jgi:serine/threonine-protein kinase HipA